MQTDFRAIGAGFELSGDFVSACPYGNGHIHDTYLAVYRNGGESRYIHQRINCGIFRDPPQVMKNIGRVTAHVRRKCEAMGASAICRRVLEIVPTREGGVLFFDESGGCWRTYRYVEGGYACQKVKSPWQAYEIARAFGEFQSMLADLPPADLRETIPNFHDTPRRFGNLTRSLEADPRNRAGSASGEIAFALRRQPLARAILDLHERGLVPERVVHNDCKPNNVILDERTHRGVCVIDLDTVMPGFSLYDFGDLVRSISSSARDEAPDAPVAVQMDLFEALACGYLESAALNRTEIDSLPLASKLIAFETGLRFLTDYLDGDVYFKIRDPLHNLRRCRAQFQLVEAIERQEDDMARVVNRLERTAPPEYAREPHADGVF